MIYENWTHEHFLISSILSVRNQHDDKTKAHMLEAVRVISKKSPADFEKLIKEVQDMKEAFYATQSALKNMRKS